MRGHVLATRVGVCYNWKKTVVLEVNLAGFYARVGGVDVSFPSPS
jgi:hypothetical protein